MKHKKFVRFVCLMMAVLMVLGVMGGVLSTMASAAVVKKKTSVHTDKQPDLTFYDIDGNLIGTFSHAAGSDLIGFNATRVIYQDEKGQEVETNYGRVDVTLHLCDGTGKYSKMTSTRESSYYLKYNLGSAAGEAFSNRITCSEGDNDTIDLDIELPNVVFRDSNEMKMNLTYQYPYVSKTTTRGDVTYIKNQTATLSFVFTKAKVDLTVTKPKNKTTITDKDTGSAPDSGYGDKDQLDKNKNQSISTIYSPDGTTVTSKPVDDTTNNNGNNSGTNNGTTVGESGNSNGEGGDASASAVFETPYLLLQEFSTGGQDQIAAGSEFSLDFTCVNTSQQVDLENIIVKIAPSEGLQVVDSTNVFYLPIINKSSSFDKSINVSVLPNAEAKSHPIDITFTYEYVLNGVRQKGEMTQQVSVQTMQPDRFTVDPIADLLESSVGEEIYITGKYVNKSRGDIYNLSATLVGDFNGAGKVEHVGNVAAGVSGEVEFSFTPDTAGPLQGEIAYTYEDTAGNVRSLSVPFSTTILEAPADDMMTGSMDVDMGMEEPQLPEESFWDKVKDPNSWQMWAVVGGVCVVAVLIAVRVVKKRKAAAEFEDDDENI